MMTTLAEKWNIVEFFFFIDWKLRALKQSRKFPSLVEIYESNKVLWGFLCRLKMKHKHHLLHPELYCKNLSRAFDENICF